MVVLGGTASSWWGATCVMYGFCGSACVARLHFCAASGEGHLVSCSGERRLYEPPPVRCVRIPGTDGCLGNASVGGCQPAILRQGGVTLHRWGTWSAMSSGVWGWFGGPGADHHLRGDGVRDLDGSGGEQRPLSPAFTSALPFPPPCSGTLWRPLTVAAVFPCPPLI